MADLEVSQALSWSAYEHDHVERESNWFWALGITAVCVALISILLSNVLFAILIVVAAITIGILARTPPVLTQFTLTERGIRVGDEMHRYDELVSFWVEENHHSGRAHLLIDTTKFMTPNIIVPLENIEPARVRMFLAEYVNETPMKEPLSHRVFEFLGL